MKLIILASEIDPKEKQRQVEEEILENVTANSALMAVAEFAKGIVYTEPFTTGWVYGSCSNFIQ